MIPMDFNNDPESNLFARLPDHEPDRQCSERIRGRCHAALLARRMESATTPVRTTARSWRLVFETTVVAAACAGYLTEVARRALDLYGF